MNHPKGFNRYGFPSHLDPWKSALASSGNDFEVNFIPDCKILHDAGYNVLTYDIRNFGHSGAGNGGIGSSGRYESRDVIGSLAFARTHKELSRMMVGLFSRCLGCNATIFAMARRPELFNDVRCLVGAQPLSPGFFLERQIELMGIPAARLADLDRMIKMVTSFSLKELSPAVAAKSVTTPTLIYQVHDDVMTRPVDVQTIFDNMPATAKDLLWIPDTTRRWDGYTFFQRHPQRVLKWLGTHMR